MAMNMDRRTLIVAGSGAMIAASTRAGAAVLAIEPDLVLVDDRCDAPASVTSRARTLRGDLIRSWRDGLGDDVQGAIQTVAYVRWDKAIMLAALGREAGMRSTTRQIARGSFEVKLTRRAAA